MREALRQRIAVLPDGEIKNMLGDCLNVNEPQSALMLARKCAEGLAGKIYERLLGSEPPTLFDERIVGLRDPAVNRGRVPGQIVNYLDNCKLFGNPAAHNRDVDVDLPAHLEDLVRVAAWYHPLVAQSQGAAIPPRRDVPNLSEVPLVKALLSRGKAKGSPAFELFNAIVRPGVRSPLRRFAGEQHLGHDGEGPRRACRVLTNVGLLISKDALEQLNPLELFSLIYAALANSAPSATAAVAALVDGLPIGSESERQRWAASVESVLAVQAVNRDQLPAHPAFVKACTIGQFTIRPRLLAMLLRLADLLDLDLERPDPPCLAAYAEWAAAGRARGRGGQLEEFVCGQQLLSVRVVCQDKASHLAWSLWLEHLREDIAFAALYVFRGDLTAFQLPAPNFCVERAAGATYSLWPLRFEIDQDGHLWDVLRRSVYTGRYDYVREIVSNGIDACVRHMFDHEATTITADNEKSPRQWRLLDYEPLVLVLIDRKENRLAICDNGVGMDRDDLQNFLFKVAGRGQARRKRDCELPTIGQFGVGFISILTRANSVRLTTSRHDGGIGLLVDIASGLREASVEELPNRPAAGTSIVLRLKEVEVSGRRGALSYLQQTVIYPSVGVVLLDCDGMKAAHSKFKEIVEELRLEGKDVPDIQPPPLAGWFEAVQYRLFTPGRIVAEAAEYLRSAQDVIDRENEWRTEENERNRLLRKQHELRLGRQKKESSKGGDSEAKVPPPSPAPPRPRLDSLSVAGGLLSINPKSLPPLPIRSPLLICLKSNGTVQRLVRIELAKPKSIAIANLAILVVPVIIEDGRHGIEWRSLHSFVLGNGVLEDEAACDIHINDHSLDEYFEQGIFLDREDSIDQLRDYVEEGLQDCGVSLRDLFDLGDDLRNRSIAPELIYKSISIKADGVRFQQVDYDGQKSEAFDLFDYMAAMTGSARRQDVFVDIARWYGHKKVICQDGIKLSEYVSRLAPVGATCGVANFTASSRLALNISRNAIDESPDRILQWRQNVGVVILKEIRRQVTACLARCGITDGYGKLWLGTSLDNPLMTQQDWDAATD